MKKQLLLFASIGILLSACAGGKREKAKSVQLMQLQPVSIGIMPSMDGLPFLIAKKQGIYDSLGIKVNFIRFNSANERDAAFQSEQIDGAITDYPSAALLQANHTEVKVVLQNRGYLCFIVSSQSKIKSRKQLKGKNIAVSRNTIAEYATDLLLDISGIKTEEVNKPEIGQISLRQQMLQYGQIDASFLPDPFASIAMNSGRKSLISTQELGINLACTAFSQKAIKEKHEEIERLIKGYNLGVEYIQMHPQKEWKQLLMEETGVPEALTGLIILPPYEKAKRPSNKEIANAIAWLKTQKRIPGNYQGNNLVDTTFVILK